MTFGLDSRLFFWFFSFWGQVLVSTILRRLEKLLMVGINEFSIFFTRHQKRKKISLGHVKFSIFAPSALKTKIIIHFSIIFRCSF